MTQKLHELVAYIAGKDGINDKARLSKLVYGKFGLIKDRSVFYCSEFAIRYCRAASCSFSNTVLSLSNLQKYDDRPFIVCIVCPDKNFLLLSNSTFLKKISHSSHQLRTDNIRGSFNGSDIIRAFADIENIPDNFDRLFSIHASIGFDGNLARLVATTTGISPTGHRLNVTKDRVPFLLNAPHRANRFVQSSYYNELKTDLDGKVSKYKNEILLASLIENINVRGRIIEYLIAGKDESLRQSLIDALAKKNQCIPQFMTENALGDYSKDFPNYRTETDVKTKIMILDSNPKAYNIDKILEFLSMEKSVFMFYFVGLDLSNIVKTVLVSMFQPRLLKATIILRHWAGRNSRGVTQLEGRTIKDLIISPNNSVDVGAATIFIQRLIDL